MRAKADKLLRGFPGRLRVMLEKQDKLTLKAALCLRTVSPNSSRPVEGQLAINVTGQKHCEFCEGANKDCLTSDPQFAQLLPCDLAALAVFITLRYPENERRSVAVATTIEQKHAIAWRLFAAYLTCEIFLKNPEFAKAF